MMKVLIVEDEKIAADRLERMVGQLMPEITTIYKADSVKTAVKWLNENHADLLFLDIQLADGLSFEIFEKIEVTSPVIFTTAYDQYAIRAFKVNSIDYLLKPVDHQQLKVSIDKFIRLNGHARIKPSEAIKEAYNMIKGKDYKERFTVKIGERIRLVEVSEVMYFESKDKMTFMAINEGRQLILDFSLDQLESLLNPRKFYRISRKHIIALEAIEDLIVYSNSRLRVRLKGNDKEDLVVARERVNDFKEWLEE